ncbi:interleukin-23 subunit alpha isoform X1 [Neovison vison]|uniref:interleukin-23 subunit alpha isoform X1 n=3 Tax=Neovison vison TaxID=452646 RepID=UPI001CF03ADD|nr:interleukin-23 subunit alpha isoform X1 [Neogale vison]
MVQSTPSVRSALVSYCATFHPVAPETRRHFLSFSGMGEKKGSGSRALKTVQIAVAFTILSVQCNRMRMQDLKPDCTGLLDTQLCDLGPPRMGPHLGRRQEILNTSEDLPREEEDDETTQEVPRIQCGDGCDPQGLEDNSQFCLQRIHQGLVFYEKLLGSDIFTGEPSPLPDGPVGQLHASLLGLRQLLQPEGHHWETEQTPSPSPSQPWQRLLLRFKILRSLQAFVAIAARVFAHGAATLSP